MKKFTEIFGFILAIIIAYSSIAKANHYQFGSIGMIIGLGIMLFPFLILFTIQFYMEHKSLIPMILGGLSTVIYLTGFLCLIQHWPGGFFLTFFGLMVLLITLLTLGIIELTKKPENRKYSVITISFIIMAASLLYAASFRTVTRSVLNGLISDNEEFMKSTNAIHNLFEIKYDLYYVTNPSKGKIYLELREKSNDLFGQIEAIKKKLASRANGGADYSNYSSVKGLDYVETSNIYMIGNGIASQLKNHINKYLEFIEANDSVFKTSGHLRQLLNVMDPPTEEGESITWESSKFLNVPVISAISNLSALQLNIRTCEMIILRNIE